MKHFVKELPPGLDPLEQYESWNEANVWSIPWTEITEDDYTLLVLAGRVKRASVYAVSNVSDSGVVSQLRATWIYT